jgi:hypothetical protein
MTRVVLLLVLALTGCSEEHLVAVRISEGALKVATSNGSAAELRALGYTAKGKIACRTPLGNTLAVVRVNCTGTTADRQPIRVTGIAREADTLEPKQEFVITIGGLEVLRKDCLATGCKE